MTFEHTNFPLQHIDRRAPDDTLPQRNTSVPMPGIGSLQEMLRLMGLAPTAADQPMPRLPVQVLRVQAGGVLLQEGWPGSTLYVVRSGSFKCLRVQEDGYEQVLTFAQAADLLGWEAMCPGACHSTAVAMEVSTVYALTIPALRQLQQQCPLIDEAMRRCLSRQLTRAAETAAILVAVASEVRLARFLLCLSSRKAEAGQSPHRLRLSMGRRDIASMLGVAHETVSRSFTTLAEAGLLRVDNREVEILDMPGLQARARCTRPGTSDHGQRPAPRSAPPQPPAQGWWHCATPALPS